MAGRSGSTRTYGRVGRPGGPGTGACDVGARSRTGAATFPIGWTLRNVRRWWRRRVGSGTGSGNRSSVRGTGGAGVGSGSGLEVPVPGVGGREDRVNGDRGDYLGPVRDRVQTGTADHGKEFERHREIAQKLDAGCYFATPTLPGNGVGTSTPTAGCARTSRRAPTAAR